MTKNFYDFEAVDIAGNKVNMSDFKGQVVLIVNTASKCGFTPQFEGLEDLYKKYKEKGFVIFGFPCNQFGNQEPNDEKSISEGCLLNYGVTFKMFSKIDVNGENEHPIYGYLKNELSGFFNDKIKWNFTKFLINKEGIPVKRFAPVIKPRDIEKDIQSLF